MNCTVDTSIYTDVCKWFEVISFKVISAILIMGTLLLACPVLAGAQSYDLVLKGGHVIDPKNDIDEPMDVAIKDGKIAEVSADIAPGDAATVV
ncbi:hypothetical protein SAMN06265218_12338, partial [Fodinibius sediminis]